MIYNDDKERNYKARFYTEAKTGRSPVQAYIDRLNDKERAKVVKYIEFLREHDGVLDEPYTKAYNRQDTRVAS